ncbi:hypothetical protein [Mariniluteicoccus flavus]
MEPTGSTPYRPDGTPPAVGSATPEEELAEVIVHEDELPQLPSNVPIYVMVGAIAALLATLGIIGYLVTRGTAEPVAVSTPDPTGVPVLPVRVGELAREPGEGQAPQDFGIDRSVQTSSAVFKKNGQVAYIVVSARPVSDPKDLLERQIKASAIRPMGDGICGRDKTDLDVCAVRRNQTTVLAIGLRSQEPKEILEFARQVLADTK